jgi:hypothetical protein
MIFNSTPDLNPELSDRRRASLADIWTPEAKQDLEQIQSVEAAGYNLSPTLKMQAGYLDIAKRAATTTNTPKDN